jgi:hypothetical protein
VACVHGRIPAPRYGSGRRVRRPGPVALGSSIAVSSVSGSGLPPVPGRSRLDHRRTSATGRDRSVLARRVVPTWPRPRHPYCPHRSRLTCELPGEQAAEPVLLCKQGVVGSSPIVSTTTAYTQLKAIVTRLNSGFAPRSTVAGRSRHPAVGVGGPCTGLVPAGEPSSAPAGGRSDPGGKDSDLDGIL